MNMQESEQITAIGEKFRELIIDRCKFCQFDKYLEENPDFEFPVITMGLLGWENGKHITIPGLFGGFDYFLEERGGGLALYAEQSSRMDSSSDDYVCFELTANGSRMLQDAEREVVWKKFRELDKKARREHLQRLKKCQEEGLA